MCPFARQLRIFAFAAICAMPTLASAQVDVQKYELDRASFQYRTNNDDSRKRCLSWYPFPEQRPSIQYDDDGQPFLMFKLRARARGKCAVRFKPGAAVRETANDDGEMSYEVLVRPPATIIIAEGPDFRDEMVLEAPIREFDDIGFFDFFRRSRVYFEARYASVSTDNKQIPVASQKIFPVFGGSLTVPVPGVPFVVVGYSMFQNLGNFVGKQENPVLFSEFAFDARLMYRAPRSWGSLYASLVGEYRGRSIYQNSEEKRSFVIGSVSVPGYGLDFGLFPGAFRYPENHWASHIGIDFSMRIAFGSLLGAGKQYGASSWDGAVSYRITPKWALGLGYSKIVQQADFTEANYGTVKEGLGNFFFRLTLLPQEEQ